MKNLRSTNYFIELLLAKLPDIFELLGRDRASLFKPLIALLKMLRTTEGEQQVIDTVNKIYEAGRQTKAGNIFTEIRDQALLKNKIDDASNDLLKDFSYKDFSYKEESYRSARALPSLDGDFEVNSSRPRAQKNSGLSRSEKSKPSIDHKQVIDNGNKVLSRIDALEQRESNKKSAKPPNRDGGQEDKRFSNVGLFDSEGSKTEHERKTPLGGKNEYYLKINIGSDEIWDSEGEGSRTSFPRNELLPKPEPRVGGFWLDVVITSHDFDIEKEQEHHKLFLPEEGDSWICDCKQDEAHHCSRNNRKRYLFVPIRTLSQAGEATLRIGFYFQNNLLQCRLFTARVGREVPEGKPGYESVTDYTLTRSLRDMDVFQHRTVNIFTNENADGSHRVILVGVDGDPQKDVVYHNILGQSEISALLKNSREALHNTHREAIWNDTKTKITGWKPLFNTINGVTHAKDRAAFIADLKVLAPLGRQMWTALFNGLGDSLRALNDKLAHGEASIQIGRADDAQNRLFYLWNLIYDIDLDITKPGQWVPCKVLDNWKPGTHFDQSQTADCPYSETHKRNTICPYGFWGFKHIIEQPFSRKDRSMQSKISPSTDGKLEMVAGYYKKMAAWPNHLVELKKRLKLDILDEASKDDLLNDLARIDSELVYFFCHGLRGDIPGTSLWMPYLTIGDDEEIQLEELNSWLGKLPAGHWEKTSPLVFINGCHTAEVSPQALADFVKFFIGANASGVIGTEVTVADTLAAEVGELFFSYFFDKVKGGDVGHAIRSMRFDFLSKGSVMGLAYTPYCSADLYLG